MALYQSPVAIGLPAEPSEVGTIRRIVRLNRSDDRAGHPNLPDRKSESMGTLVLGKSGKIGEDKQRKVVPADCLRLSPSAAADSGSGTTSSLLREPSTHDQMSYSCDMALGSPSGSLFAPVCRRKIILLHPLLSVAMAFPKMLWLTARFP